jgi:hypothetical protein
MHATTIILSFRRVLDALAGHPAIAGAVTLFIWFSTLLQMRLLCSSGLPHFCKCGYFVHLVQR